MKTSRDPNYCVRVTANDGERGEQFLRDFKDNERTIPTVLTTSQKLSTGVDARNVRNIVLLRPINSMIEFKQIIGRGTRLYEGKEYFTIWDFVKAHHHFNDPEWDGEPLDQTSDEPARPRGKAAAAVIDSPEPEDDEPERPQRLVIRLADGKERTLQNMSATSFWSADGRPMSAQQFLESLFGALPELFKDEDELRRLWSMPETRKALMSALSDRGFPIEALIEIQKIVNAEQSDLFDVLAYVAYAAATHTRAERAASAASALPQTLTPKQRQFIEFVLSQYVQQGVQELDEEKLAPLLRLRYNNAISDAIAELGPPDRIRQLFIDFQRGLYRD